jgi:curli biogenesis system outer membrane secretion channel CsgG
MEKHLFSCAAAVAASLALLGGCATETSQALTVPQVASAARGPTGPRVVVSIGKFDNRSSYQRGLFSDGVDRLGSQSRTLLVSHLHQSRRFSVQNRENMGETQQEAMLSGQAQALRGARFIITGNVTEFGRKETGDHQLFGILGKGKTQVAHAKVSLNVVNTVTAEVVHAVQGAGEYSLSNREVIGFGGTASYDATLNGKVLDLAIRQAVDQLASDLDSGAWRTHP